MKKKILLLLSLFLLIGCQNNNLKKKEASNEEKSQDYKKIEIEQKFVDMPIKTGKLGEFYEISIQKAEEISKNDLSSEKILSKDKINEDKSYIILEYIINDLRPNPDYSTKSNYTENITCKSYDGEIVKKEEISSSKINPIIREIIEVESVGKKIDINFKAEKDELDMKVIL
ncbi:hypothetical protein HV819_09760 [Anaerococcus sp. AGMB00486]|uniref:Lipoprotein n=2 Tax=Anaerococcus TaxID=165779 RepID=A0ABX2NCH0_9FIRM|nr:MULTISPECIES: hypothetical protein [Anaerococcus]MSS77805.1 hypothetical protein [Anaerococcus porci]NVF12239.1 hypothetical protein [Anaerococcus faecalis]